jgi:O-antigen/teichoic acid export membrane protein
MDSAIVFLGGNLSAVFQFLYYIICVRLLSPQDYGTFNALIIIASLTSVAFSPLGPTFTRFFTEYITKKDFTTLIFVFSKLIKKLLVVGILTFCGLFIFSSSLAQFLKTQKIYIIICGLIVAGGLLATIIPSLFQSFQKFKLYSLAAILSSLAKLIFGALFMLWGWKVSGALWGFFATPLAIIIFALFVVPKIFKKEAAGLDIKPSGSVDLSAIYRYFFPVSLMLLCFHILTNIDVILVKRFFSGLDAGYYSIAQIMGKIALFLPAPLAVAAFPKITSLHVANKSPLKILYKSLFITAICCFVITAISFLFPEFILKIIAGKLNPVSKDLLGLFSLAMSFYALLFIMINFLIATHNLKFVLPLVFFAFLEAMFICIFHDSLKTVLSILVIFSIISFLSSIFTVKFSSKSKLA